MNCLAGISIIFLSLIFSGRLEEGDDVLDVVPLCQFVCVGLYVCYYVILKLESHNVNKLKQEHALDNIQS